MCVKENSSTDIVFPQSAVIPFKIENNRLKILLITSINKQQWIFPKGIIEENLSPQQSALQEAKEEAGAEGEVLSITLGEYSYPKWGGICEVVVFPMYVTRLLDDWPEANIRKRKWVSIEEAFTYLSKEDLRKLLELFELNLENIKSLVKDL